MHGKCPLHPNEQLTPGPEGRDQTWGYEGIFHYGRCPCCDSLTLVDGPPKEQIGRYYGDYYTPQMLASYRNSHRGKKPEAAAALDYWRAKFLIKCQQQVKSPLRARMKVLDVGCAFGGLCRFLRDLAGVDVEGVDFAPQCREMASELHQVEVKTGELADQHYKAASFDLIAAFHCLEHVFDPLAEIAEYRRILKPAGWLHIQVPSEGVLGRLFGGRWAFLQPPTHLHHYRPQALRAMLTAAGFEQVTILHPWLPTELLFSLMLALGVNRVVPRIILAVKDGGSFWLKLLLILLLPLDLMVTGSLAVMRGGGVIHVMARKSEKGVASG